MVDGGSRLPSGFRKTFRNGWDLGSLTQIKIDSIPAILPSFHCVQAQNTALLKVTKILWGTSSCTNGSIWEIPDADNEGWRTL